MSRKTIPLSAPYLSGNEIRYLKETVKTNWVSSEGPFVRRFEKIFQDRLPGATAVAVMNGTSALHIALLVAGVEPGDEVIVPALSFVATANAVAYCGAHPTFIDCDSSSWCLDVAKLNDFLSKECVKKGTHFINRHTRRRVRAVLPVHVLGHPSDMDEIVRLAHRYHLAVIEDACEGLGSRYKGRPVGLLSDIACFSFNGNKIVTAGGGGMIVTRNKKWAQRAKYLTTQARQDPREYIHGDVGYNYRLTNLQAAVGCAQMEQLPAFLRKKRQIARVYEKAFSAIPHAGLMPSESWATPNYWLYTMRLAPGLSPTDLVGHLAQHGIESRRLWCPLHLLPMYKKEFAYRVEEAVALYAQAISLPSSPSLSKSDQAKVVRHVLEFVKGQVRRHS